MYTSNVHSSGTIHGPFKRSRNDHNREVYKEFWICHPYFFRSKISTPLTPCLSDVTNGYQFDVFYYSKLKRRRNNHLCPRALLFSSNFTRVFLSNKFYLWYQTWVGTKVITRPQVGPVVLNICKVSLKTTHQF